MPDCLRMSVKRMAAGAAGFFADCRAGDLWDEKKRDERCEAREILGGGKVCGHRVRSARERAICRNCWRAGMGRGCSGAAAEVWGALARACSIRLTSKPPEEWLPLKRERTSRALSYWPV